MVAKTIAARLSGNISDVQRCGLIRALGAIFLSDTTNPKLPDYVIDALHAELNSGNLDIVSEAARAVGKVRAGRTEIIDKLLSISTNLSAPSALPNSAIEALGRCQSEPENVIPVLVSFLGQEEPPEEVFGALAAYGDRAVGPLITRWKLSADSERVTIARCFERIQSPASPAIPLLTAALGSSDSALAHSCLAGSRQTWAGYVDRNPRYWTMFVFW